MEHVHSEGNRVLSSHGPFNSKSIHQYAKLGTDEHTENMEAVAEEVRKCLVQTSFGGKQLMCYRGVKPEDYVVSDEEQLQDFLYQKMAESTTAHQYTLQRRDTALTAHFGM